MNKARNLGVRASQHTAKVINQVHTKYGQLEIEEKKHSIKNMRRKKGVRERKNIKNLHTADVINQIQTKI